MHAANDNNPLYTPETMLARLVLGKDATTVKWSAVATILEREGLPRIDPLIGCRYYPAVRAFFDRRHGLTSSTVPSGSDGAENWA